MPPHRPLSVVTTMMATVFALSCLTKIGCVYSGLACDRFDAILRILSLKGRAARILSCALRNLDAATISIALVIFFVISTLLIMPRISYPAAMSQYSLTLQCSSESFFEIGNRGGQFCFAVLVELLGIFNLLQQCAMAGFHEVVQSGFECQHALDLDVIEIAFVHGKQRHGHQ